VAPKRSVVTQSVSDDQSPPSKKPAKIARSSSSDDLSAAINTRKQRLESSSDDDLSAAINTRKQHLESSSDNDPKTVNQQVRDSGRAILLPTAAGSSDDETTSLKKPAKLPWTSFGGDLKPKSAASSANPAPEGRQTTSRLRSRPQATLDTSSDDDSKTVSQEDAVRHSALRFGRRVAARASASSDDDVAQTSVHPSAEKVDSARPLAAGDSDEPPPRKGGPKAATAASLQRIPDSDSDSTPPTASAGNRPRVVFPSASVEEEEEEPNDPPAPRKHLTAEEILTKYHFSDSEEFDDRTSAPQGGRQTASGSDSS
jgi:hypothetical protein